MRASLSFVSNLLTRSSAVSSQRSLPIPSCSLLLLLVRSSFRQPQSILYSIWQFLLLPLIHVRVILSTGAMLFSPWPASFGSQCVGHDSEWIVGRLLKNAAFFVLQSAPPTSTSSSASAPPSVPSAPAILPPEPDGDELIGSSASVAVSYVANPLEALRLQSLKRQRTAVLPQQLSPTELVRMEVEAFWRHTFLAHEKQPHSNPLSFWQFHEKKYPILSRLALRLLSLPSSSAEAERTFSKAGHIISSLRSQITPTNADRLIFVAMNKHLYSPSIPVTTSAAALAAEAVAEAAAVSAASAVSAL